jgi:hypothetical protein
MVAFLFGRFRETVHDAKIGYMHDNLLRWSVYIFHNSGEWPGGGGFLPVGGCNLNEWNLAAEDTNIAERFVVSRRTPTPTM